ncbi:MAG: hypothetical protein PHR06_10280 [Candidatus Cloacimonetes bacterium]|nr:hypothetical protein [Candidatus Cloacimonadota bacterium]
MKKIILILIAVSVALISLIIYQKSVYKAPLVALEIIFNERVYQLTDLEKFTENEVNVAHIKRTNDSSSTISAYRVESILSHYQIDTQNINSVSFLSRDGGKILIKSDELSNMYLTESDNETESYIRLIIPTDPFANRWLKYVEKIVIE